MKTMVGSWGLEPQTSTVSKRRHYVLPITRETLGSALVRRNTCKPEILLVKLQVKNFQSEPKYTSELVRASLCAKRAQWIHLRGTAGGHVAGGEGRQCEDCGHQAESYRIGWSHAEEKTFHRACKCERADDA